VQKKGTTEKGRSRGKVTNPRTQEEERNQQQKREDDLGLKKKKKRDAVPIRKRESQDNVGGEILVQRNSGFQQKDEFRLREKTQKGKTANETPRKRIKKKKEKTTEETAPKEHGSSDEKKKEILGRLTLKKGKRISRTKGRAELQLKMTSLKKERPTCVFPGDGETSDSKKKRREQIARVGTRITGEEKNPAPKGKRVSKKRRRGQNNVEGKKSQIMKKKKSS